jgi:hypothetical protein
MSLCPGQNNELGHDAEHFRRPCAGADAAAPAVPTLMLFAHRLDLPLAVPAAKARP